ncbi:unnamed protein product [Acanthoscelides obtectus]|nr:unnamed protein product [Acanthoscelides obtectus]CAK1631892.1 hypothetical protein AOBTE_LOCUS7230 [Acanthoscelides obtectus]
MTPTAVIQAESEPQETPKGPAAKHRFSLSLFKRHKQSKKKINESGSDIVKNRQEDSDSESSDDSFRENARSRSRSNDKPLRSSISTSVSSKK